MNKRAQVTSSRRRSALLRVIETPVRMRQVRMPDDFWECPKGLLCIGYSTRAFPF